MAPKHRNSWCSCVNSADAMLITGHSASRGHVVIGLLTPVVRAWSMKIRVRTEPSRRCEGFPVSYRIISQQNALFSAYLLLLEFRQSQIGLYSPRVFRHVTKVSRRWTLR